VLTMQPPTLRTVLAAAVPVGVVVSATVVWQSTSAAFTASTDNAGNSWQSGTVVLTDSDSGAALFTTTDDGALKPGSTRSRCIQVDYTGDLDADIRLYVTAPESTTDGTPAPVVKSLDPYLLMTVERGADITDGSTLAGDCTGFTPSTVLFTDTTRTMAQLKTHGDYDSGLRVGTTPVSQDTHLTFKIAYLVEDDNAAQDAESKATFVWEAHNS
jgi:hypothetical protein